LKLKEVYKIKENGKERITIKTKPNKDVLYQVCDQSNHYPPNYATPNGIFLSITTGDALFSADITTARFLPFNWTHIDTHARMHAHTHAHTQTQRERLR